ncbi:MAG: FHA domain-containing protein [Tepidisphaeraceae bacterium]|jgi:hypothetical protein
MEYVIRVIEGPDTGAEAKIPPGQTIVGRSTSAGLRLSSPEISWEHLIVTRNGDEYLVENLSARGTILDGNRISGQVRLRPPEQFRLCGDTVIRVERSDAAAGALNRWRVGILGVISLSIVGAAVFLAMGSRESAPSVDNWDRAYSFIQPWLEREAKAGRLPADTPAVFREAWRLDQAKAYDKSQEWWLRVQILLESQEDRRHLKATAAENPGVLQRILTPRREDADPSDEDLAIAAVQFTNRRMTWAARQGKSSSGFFK